jgi:antitoxin (DNA-binding transcriptional repressor) of toxin-antitoxin stability system
VTIVSSSEMSSNLPLFLARAAAGEEFIIVDSGKEVARIIPPGKAEKETIANQTPMEESSVEENPWRGVFVLSRARRPIGLFGSGSQLSKLTPRQPSPNFNFSKAQSDNA